MSLLGKSCSWFCILYTAKEGSSEYGENDTKLAFTIDILMVALAELKQKS